MRSWSLYAAHLPCTPAHLPLARVQFHPCLGLDHCSRRQNRSSLALSQALLSLQPTATSTAQRCSPPTAGSRSTAKTWPGQVVVPTQEQNG